MGGLLAEGSFRINVPYVASQAGWHLAIVVPGGSTVRQRSHPVSDLKGIAFTS